MVGASLNSANLRDVLQSTVSKISVVDVPSPTQGSGENALRQVTEGTPPWTPVSIAPMAINVALLTLTEGVPSISAGGIRTIHQRNL